MAEPIASFVFTTHSRVEIRRRGIGDAEVGRVLRAPGQRIPIRPGRDILQARTEHHGRVYLLRVVVDVDSEPAQVVTAYRTSRIDKYWRNEE